MSTSEPLTVTAKRVYLQLDGYQIVIYDYLWSHSNTPIEGAISIPPISQVIDVGDKVTIRTKRTVSVNDGDEILCL